MAMLRNLGGDRTQQALHTCRRTPPSPSQRTARWAETLWAQAVVASWDAAIASTWWRWRGHLARLTEREPDRWGGIATAWCDACWTQTVRGPVCYAPPRALGKEMMGRGDSKTVQRILGDAATIAVERTRPRRLGGHGRPVRGQTSSPMIYKCSGTGQVHDDRGPGGHRTSTTC